MKSLEIDSLEKLRSMYANAGERAMKKQLSSLDGHCRRFINLSPFLVMATSGKDVCMDASPRGGEPGFVSVTEAGTVLIPDWPGNNRLDSLENLISNPHIGLIFLIPGVDETLRVNGVARLSIDAAHLQACARLDKLPKLVICVQVREAYLHCAKALMRSQLWNAVARQERSVLPSMNQMIADQMATPVLAETQEQMLERYRSALY